MRGGKVRRGASRAMQERANRSGHAMGRRGCRPQGGATCTTMHRLCVPRGYLNREKETIIVYILSRCINYDSRDWTSLLFAVLRHEEYYLLVTPLLAAYRYDRPQFGTVSSAVSSTGFDLG